MTIWEGFKCIWVKSDIFYLFLCSSALETAISATFKTHYGIKASPSILCPMVQIKLLIIDLLIGCNLHDILAILALLS